VKSIRAFPLVFSLLAFAACGDDGDTSPRAAGGGCGDDADCQTGLICEFQLCHQPCVTDSVCPGAQRCVRGLQVDDAGTSRRLCQLDESTACTAAVDCLGKQVCASGECRDECSSASQCTSDQTCAANDRCYSDDPAKDPTAN
jgi:hypothetical protein